jgi:hypothetical protein
MARIIFDTIAAVAPSATHSCIVEGANVVTLEQTGLGADEVVTLQKQSRTTFEDLYIDGELQQLTATNMTIQVYGPAKIYFNKDVTAAAVEVRELSTFNM